MTEEELLAEEYICNGKCQDDITRNYVHCKTCTRLKDFLAGYKVGKTELEKENAELKKTVTKMNNVITETFSKLTKAKDLLKRCYENYIYLEPLRSEIEQFISEVEK